MRVKVQDEIEKRIKHKGRGKLYVNTDFADLGAPDAVRQALRRLQKDEFILRITRGVYCYPKIDKVLGLGVLKPSIYDVAYAIARRDRISLIPNSDVALNQLGLSTQVPANLVFYTNGTSRTIKLATGKGIKFIHTNDNKMLAYHSNLMLLIVLAMKEVGEQQLTDNDWTILRTYIAKVSKKDFAHDIKLAPTWIQKKMHTI